jgi:hypothetical protein
MSRDPCVYRKPKPGHNGDEVRREVELVEKNKLKDHNVERSQNLLIMLNDLMANYQILRQRNERCT